MERLQGYVYLNPAAGSPGRPGSATIGHIMVGIFQKSENLGHFFSSFFKDHELHIMTSHTLKNVVSLLKVDCFTIFLNVVIQVFFFEEKNIFLVDDA